MEGEIISDKLNFNKSLFIFHRSLRLHDNIGLISALNDSEYVIPIFIFTPEQITTNKYKSLRSIKFMIDALKDIDKQLRKKKSKLYVFYGKQHIILNKILKDDDTIDAVYINEDYTPYAISRERKLVKVCESHGIDLFSCEDVLLHSVNRVSPTSKDYYSKFTPFYKAIIKLLPVKPYTNNNTNYIKSNYKLSGEITLTKIINKLNLQNIDISHFVATRKEAVKRLTNLNKHKKYPINRNNLTMNTTRLSVYIKFGIVSIREVYHRIKALFGKNHDLIKQLYWREFYFNLVYNVPHVLKHKSFKLKYDKITWKQSTTLFNKWKTGKTGYPIVDAGMRELLHTGFMHNRARLITADFLVKLMHIDWRKGEQYFATQLIDYDPSVNNGNWQWISGSGADSQPYFRIFNPWTQGLKFDKNCNYIKKWIPELKDVPAKDIHNWTDTYNNYKTKYPKPCIDYETQRNKVKNLYKKIY